MDKRTLCKSKIAFLTTQWKDIDDNIRRGKAPGGVPSIAGIWTHALRHGYEPHVFILTETEPGWPRETMELGGVHFHWIEKPFRGITNWLHDRRLIGLAKPLWLIWQLQMFWRIWRSGIRPDLVYAMRTTFSVLGWLWARWSGAPLVQRQYGTWLYHTWFEQRNCFKRLEMLGSLLAFKIPTDLFITTNDGTSGDVVARWAGFPMDRFRFWINGVNKEMRIQDFDHTEFRRQHGLSEDTFVLMTLGRLSYWKRLDRIIDAMPEILKKASNTHLLIVGGGEQRGDLERQVRERGVSQAVTFIGPVSHTQIKEYLNGCDIFIMCNDLTNMCNTLIEAMTTGCCVVTRDVGSTTEIVSNGENAVVLNPGEADDIADAVIALLADSDRRQRLAHAAYRYAMQRFQNWDERMDMEMEELRRLMKAKGKRVPVDNGCQHLNQNIDGE